MYIKNIFTSSLLIILTLQSSIALADGLIGNVVTGSYVPTPGITNYFNNPPSTGLTQTFVNQPGATFTSSGGVGVPNAQVTFGNNTLNYSFNSIGGEAIQDADMSFQFPSLASVTITNPRTISAVGQTISNATLTSTNISASPTVTNTGNSIDVGFQNYSTVAGNNFANFQATLTPNTSLNAPFNFTGRNVNGVYNSPFAGPLNFFNNPFSDPTPTTVTIGASGANADFISLPPEFGVDEFPGIYVWLQDNLIYLETVTTGLTSPVPFTLTFSNLIDANAFQITGVQVINGNFPIIPTTSFGGSAVSLDFNAYMQANQYYHAVFAVTGVVAVPELDTYLALGSMLGLGLILVRCSKGRKSEIQKSSGSS